MMKPDSYFPRPSPVGPVGLAGKRNYAPEHLEGGCLLIRPRFGAAGSQPSRRTGDAEDDGKAATLGPAD